MSKRLLPLLMAVFLILTSSFVTVAYADEEYPEADFDEGANYDEEDEFSDEYGEEYGGDPLEELHKLIGQETPLVNRYMSGAVPKITLIKSGTGLVVNYQKEKISLKGIDENVQNQLLKLAGKSVGVDGLVFADGNTKQFIAAAVNGMQEAASQDVVLKGYLRYDSGKKVFSLDLFQKGWFQLKFDAKFAGSFRKLVNKEVLVMGSFSKNAISIKDEKGIISAKSAPKDVLGKVVKDIQKLTAPVPIERFYNMLMVSGMVEKDDKGLNTTVRIYVDPKKDKGKIPVDRSLLLKDEFNGRSYYEKAVYLKGIDSIVQQELEKYSGQNIKIGGYLNNKTYDLIVTELFAKQQVPIEISGMLSGDGNVFSSDPDSPNYIIEADFGGRVSNFYIRANSSMMEKVTEFIDREVIVKGKVTRDIINGYEEDVVIVESIEENPEAAENEEPNVFEYLNKFKQENKKADQNTPAFKIDGFKAKSWDGDASQFGPNGMMPPQGGNNPPQGGNMPPQGGKNPPPGGYMPPNGGKTPPPGGYMPPNGGKNPPPGGYMPPNGGKNPPPGGYMPPKDGMNPTPPPGDYMPPNGGMNPPPPPGGYMPPKDGMNPPPPPGGYMPPNDGMNPTPPPPGGYMPPNDGMNPAPGGYLPPKDGMNPTPPPPPDGTVPPSPPPPPAQ
ncbi:MAG: proline-rich domain-containing protein [Clostridia bacterium]|nr:proline-rich domain-containing protein [Clostridia bacterium]